MAVIRPHINFNGNAAAFTFYKSVFGGAFAKIIRFKGLASPEFPVAEKEENKIMHIALPIGKSNMSIGNDVPEMMGKTNENEHRSKIAITAADKKQPNLYIKPHRDIYKLIVLSWSRSVGREGSSFFHIRVNHSGGPRSVPYGRRCGK